MTLPTGTDIETIRPEMRLASYEIAIGLEKAYGLQVELVTNALAVDTSLGKLTNFIVSTTNIDTAFYLTSKERGFRFIKQQLTSRISEKLNALIKSQSDSFNNQSKTKIRAIYSNPIVIFRGVDNTSFVIQLDCFIGYLNN